MDCYTIVEHDAFLTSLVSPHADCALYSIESSRRPEGWWSSSIRRVDSKSGDVLHTELANVSYLSWGSTRVAFGRQEVDLDAFLRRQNTFSNSRVFIAPDGQTYKWRIKGQSLELYHLPTNTLLARSHPARRGLLPTKSRPASLDISRKDALGDDAQMLDAIVVTYTIMQHTLQDRLSYRYPS